MNFDGVPATRQLSDVEMPGKTFVQSGKVIKIRRHEAGSIRQVEPIRPGSAIVRALSCCKTDCSI